MKNSEAAPNIVPVNISMANNKDENKSSEKDDSSKKSAEKIVARPGYVKRRATSVVEPLIPAN